MHRKIIAVKTVGRGQKKGAEKGSSLISLSLRPSDGPER
jgi:hypothetical protein